MRILQSALLGLAMITGVVNVATATTIDFENDASGTRASGFSSIDSPGVTFSDSLGGNLIVQDFGGGVSNGHALGTVGNGASILVIHFPGLLRGMRVAFGNDVLCCTSVGDIAQLHVFNGLTQVGEVSTPLNRNGVMDQTVSYSGSDFDSATFAYANSTGNPIALAEVVDDIVLDPANLPEPATLALFGAGLAGLGAARRRRRAKA